MTVCSECGGPLDPTVTHVLHNWDCDYGGGLYEGCDCPETCAACCRQVGCPMREPQETTVTPTYKGPTVATLARNLDLCRSMENGTPLTCGLPTGHDGPHSFDSPVPDTPTPTGQTPDTGEKT